MGRMPAHSITTWPAKAAPKSPLGFIGMSLEAARAPHFFQWFHLEPATPPDAGSFLFRPKWGEVPRARRRRCSCAPTR
jgi:hypothetical protein